MPLAALMGIRVATVEAGRSRVELDSDARHSTPLGTMHGGALCMLADIAMGLAYGSTLDESETFATLELKINFLRPVRRASLVAEAVVVRTGRNTGMAECTVMDQRGRLVAKASSTCMTRRDARSPRNGV